MQDTNNNNTITHAPKEEFAGQSDYLKGFIYDVTNSKGGVGYNWTTEEIAGYVGEKYTSTRSYIRTAVLMLEVPTPDWPPPPIATKTPATVNQIDQEIFKEIICM